MLSLELVRIFSYFHDASIALGIALCLLAALTGSGVRTLRTYGYHVHEQPHHVRRKRVVNMMQNTMMEFHGVTGNLNRCLAQESSARRSRDPFSSMAWRRPLAHAGFREVGES